jgi:hypothetical protein
MTFKFFFLGFLVALTILFILEWAAAKDDSMDI